VQENDHYRLPLRLEERQTNCMRQSPSEASSSASHKIENASCFIKFEESILPSQQLTAEPHPSHINSVHNFPFD